VALRKRKKTIFLGGVLSRVDGGYIMYPSFPLLVLGISNLDIRKTRGKSEGSDLELK
jgi:hypothetical protein